MNVTPRLFACLSPEEIGVSEKIGSSAAAFAVLVILTLLILNWRRSSFRWLPLYGVLLIVDPAWWMSVYMGDCGYAKRFLSIAISVVFAAVLLCQCFLPRLPTRGFLLILSATCWLAYAASRLYWQIVDHAWILDFVARVFSSVAIKTFLFASPTLFYVAIVSSFVTALLYGLSWSRTDSVP